MTEREFLESFYHHLIKHLGNCGLGKNTWRGAVIRVPLRKPNPEATGPAYTFAIDSALYGKSPFPWVRVASTRTKEPLDFSSSLRPKKYDPAQTEDLKQSLNEDLQYLTGLDRSNVPDFLNLDEAIVAIGKTIDSVATKEFEGFEFQYFLTRIAHRRPQLVFSYHSSNYGYYQAISLEFDLEM